MTHHLVVGYSRLMVMMMIGMLLVSRSGLVEPSPLPILIRLGPKYMPQGPAFKYPQRAIPLYCKRQCFTTI